MYFEEWLELSERGSRQELGFEFCNCGSRQEMEVKLGLKV